MALDIGGIQGLAQDFQFDQRINDLRHQQEQQQRAKAIAAAKQKMFLDDIDYQNAMNAYDNPRIKAFTQGLNKQLGAYIRENPDWETNMDKRMQVKAIQRQYKDNPLLHKGIASDTAMRELDKAMAEVAKNPEQHDVGAYQELARQKQNYLQHGNQYGPEAKKMQGEQIFVFTKPRDFIPLDKTGLELGNKFKGASMDIEYLKNGRDGAYKTVPKKELLDAAANQFYNENKRQFDVQYTSKGQDPIAAAKQFILSGIDTKFDIGNRNTLNDELYKIRYKNSLEQATAKNESPYKVSILGPGRSAPNPADLAETFGSKVVHYFRGPDGKLVRNTGDVFNYDGNIYDKGYDEKKPYQKTGIKQADGYIYKPLEWGKENGYTYDPWGFGDNAVEPGMKDVIEIVDSPVNDKGESTKLLKVKAVAEVNANDPYYEAKFNKNILTTKQRNGIGVESGLLNQEVLEDEVGNKFVQDASGRYIPFK